MTGRRGRVAARAALVLGLQLCSGIVRAADGEALYRTHGCGNCHGVSGKQPILGSYPKLAGQNREYLLNQLADFKSGARGNGAAAVMRGVMAPLNAEDMAALALYLSER